jgi:hypothetical protein
VSFLTGHIEWTGTILALLVDVGSCLQQSLNCLSMSLQGSYPQRNSTTLSPLSVVAWWTSAPASSRSSLYEDMSTTSGPLHQCVPPVSFLTGHIEWTGTILALLVDVGSCLQQSLNCLSMSLQGSYPQRNITTLGGGLVDISTSLQMAA